MAQKLLILLVCFLASCATSKPTRDIAHNHNPLLGEDVNGTFLGVGQYKRSLIQPAMRIYLSKGQEAGTYDAVLLEYHALRVIGPRYAAKNVEGLNNLIGYLKKITKKIWAYRLVPVDGNPNAYRMYEFRSQNGELEIVEENARLLTLNANAGENHRLEGALITEGRAGEPEIYFPYESKYDNEGWRRYLDQRYHSVNFLYERADLKSTWRMNAIPGPYLAAYYKLDDEVLSWSHSGNQMFANFVEGSKKEKGEARRKIFTNPKSADLRGRFQVRHPARGIFTFTAINENSLVGEEIQMRNALVPPAASKQELESRLGLFIDIFDATESRNEDVVELALINPEDPEDFLMYYEHPENGEGQ